MPADNTVICSIGSTWKRACRGGGMLWREADRKSGDARQNTKDGKKTLLAVCRGRLSEVVFDRMIAARVKRMV